jgi:hypothetical protein
MSSHSKALLVLAGVLLGVAAPAIGQIAPRERSSGATLVQPTPAKTDYYGRASDFRAPARYGAKRERPRRGSSA